MTTDTPNLPAAPKPQLRAGGEVMAIVPQTFEETMRIARAVCIGGLAPAALIGNLTGDNAASAVAIAIMSGAELGLQPMVALRSFTVINGKPALYGDGLINVVRQSGKVKRLATGHTKAVPLPMLIRAGKLPDPNDYPRDQRAEIVAANKLAYEAMSPAEKECGWCDAERIDTGESKLTLFTVADAENAGLWSPSPHRRGKVWRNGKQEWVDDAPNDSPWHRYPQRMLAWRAAGYCLRELFGDVLGGIRDEFEAREIAEREEGMVDVTPAARQVQQRPTPPEPPADDEPEAKGDELIIDARLISKSELDAFDDAEDARRKAEAETDVEGSTPGEDESPADFLTRLDEDLAIAGDKATLLEIWEDADAATLLDGTPFAEDAEKIYARHETRVAKMELEAAGQSGFSFGGDDDTFPGDRK